MTLSPAPVTRSPRLTLAKSLGFAPRERTFEHGRGKKKYNARSGRNRSVTSGLSSLSLGPGGAGTPDAKQAGTERPAGTQDNRPAREAGAPRSRSCSSPGSGGASEAPLPPQRSRSSAPRPCRPHPLSKAVTCHCCPGDRRDRPLQPGCSRPEERDPHRKSKRVSRSIAGTEEAPPTPGRFNCRERPGGPRCFLADASDYAFRRTG